MFQQIEGALESPVRLVPGEKGKHNKKRLDAGVREQVLLDPLDYLKECNLHPKI